MMSRSGLKPSRRSRMRFAARIATSFLMSIVPPAVEIAVLFGQGEGIDGPGLANGLHDIEVRIEEYRLPLPRP